MKIDFPPGFKEDLVEKITKILTEEMMSGSLKEYAIRFPEGIIKIDSPEEQPSLATGSICSPQMKGSIRILILNDGLKEKTTSRITIIDASEE